ncbi:hypothetical protein T07_14924, partial [Trichinella nelsoni]
LPKTKKYFTRRGNFNEYVIIMLKKNSVPEFSYPGSVSTKFHFGCFPVY